MGFWDIELSSSSLYGVNFGFWKRGKKVKAKVKVKVKVVVVGLGIWELGSV